MFVKSLLKYESQNYRHSTGLRLKNSEPLPDNSKKYTRLLFLLKELIGGSERTLLYSPDFQALDISNTTQPAVYIIINPYYCIKNHLYLKFLQM